MEELLLAIQQVIETISRAQSFSGVVHVSHQGETLLKFYQGLANRSEKIPNQIDTHFQIASGTKFFTALAAAKLVERGKLEWDVPISAYLDLEETSFSPKITMRHLLTHSSGITSYFEEDIDPDYEKLWQDRPVYRMREPKDFLPMYQNKPMKFEPGDQFEYNDGGFVLAGAVIEAAANTPFVEFVSSQVLAPLGMVDSGFFYADHLPERTALGYIEENGKWRTNVFSVPIVGGGDGGMYTTAPDLVKFWQAVNQGLFLSEKIWEELLAVQIASGHEAPYDHYGLGVWIHLDAGEICQHFITGLDPGVSFHSVYDHRHELVYSVLSNTDYGAWKMEAAIAKVLAV